MPVLGHAFVGLAIAQTARPPAQATWRAGLWTPTVVVLAYLPDVAGELASFVGWRDSRIATHALLPNAAIAIFAGLALARACGARRAAAIAVAASAVVSHVLLDLLQGEANRPWWPLSRAAVGARGNVIPANSIAEALAFGAACGAYLLLLRLLRRRAAPAPPRRGAAIGAAGVATLLAAASLVHALRAAREADLDAAQELLRAHSFEAALTRLDAAARWPSPIKTARLHLARGAALEGLADRTGAVREYSAACDEDPRFFWNLESLAVCLARGPDPPSERAARVAPWRARLEAEFPDHADLPRTLARLDRLLAQPGE